MKDDVKKKKKKKKKKKNNNPKSQIQGYRNSGHWTE